MATRIPVVFLDAEETGAPGEREGNDAGGAGGEGRRPENRRFPPVEHSGHASHREGAVEPPSGGKPSPDEAEGGRSRPESVGTVPGGDGTESARRRVHPNRSLPPSASELIEQYQRLKADFANYKRRTEKERESDRARGADEAIGRILPARQALLQALETARASRATRAIGEGLALTLAEIDKALGEYGIEPMKTVGEPFDPRLHEAVSVEEDGGVPPGTVLSEVSPGYTKHGDTFRPARVIVSR